jgi:protease I
VQLPEPTLSGTMSFEQALLKRQTAELPGTQRLKFSEIGQLAWAGQGVTKPVIGIAPTASPDEVYPVKLYFVIPEGIYLYSPSDHTLQQSSNADARNELATVVSGQRPGPAPGCGIVVAGSVRSLSTRGVNDARKAMLMQAGQAVQNILLQTVGMELGFTVANNFDAAGVRRVCRFARNLEPLCVIFVGYPASQEQAAGTSETAGAVTKRAVLIVPRVFRDEELFETKRLLELASVQTIIAGTRTGPLMSMLGRMVEVALPLNQVNVDEFDAVVFIGGAGALDFFNNLIALNIAQQAVSKGKVLAAISIAPMILANAGVLRGTRATSFISERDRLIQAGAIYTGAPVERDNLIITATDPLAVPMFVRAILDALSGR